MERRHQLGGRKRRTSASSAAIALPISPAVMRFDFATVLVRAFGITIARRLLGMSGSILPKHYWENFTPLVTPKAFVAVGVGTQFFKKHLAAPDLESKFQA